MRTVVALCVIAVALGGCGGANSRDSAEEFKGEERSVAQAIEAIETAARDDDAAKVCTQLLSDSLLAALEKKGTNCTTGVNEGFDDADSVDLEVEDVTISGESATAKVVSGRAGSAKKTDVLKLERDGAAWKIASLGTAAER